MDELVAFLLARLVEDQTEIDKHPDDAHEADGFHATTESGYPCFEVLTIGKRRALAELNAKRRIIELHEREVIFGTDVLRLLALPYASHPDYHEKWKPVDSGTLR